MEQLKKRLAGPAARRRLVIAAYLLVALGWLVVRLVQFAADRASPESAANPADYYPIGMVRQADGSYLTETGDPQLLFPAPKAAVRTVLVNADFSQDPGEMELFYLQTADQPFALQRRAVGRPVDGGQGAYLFRLPQEWLLTLRLDPGFVAGNRVQLHSITINPRLPAAFYFVPGLRQLLAFLLLPALALCVFFTIIEGIGTALEWRARRKKTHGG